MANAKEEFLNAINNKNVKCAFIALGADWHKESQKIFTLKINYTEKEYDSFLSELDFEYDDGYGGQELFGNVWFDNETWLSRGEYDGSEWWEYNKLPEIPKECL